MTKIFADPRYRNYLFLLPLFAVVLFYQLTYSVVAVTTQASVTSIAFARFETQDQVVSDVDEIAAAAGLRRGDRILTIDGHPFTNNHVLFEELKKLRPGQALDMMVAPPNQPQPHMMHLSTRMREDLQPSASNWTFSIVVTAIMLGCAALGVYVAAVLPRDSRALFLFGVLASTAQIVTTVGWSDFPRELWAFADAAHTVAVLTWPVWLILFGISFPERSDWDVKRPWIKWLLLGPIILWNLVLGLGTIAAYSDFRAFAGVDALLRLRFINDGLLPTLGVGFFFGSLRRKFAYVASQDARRRLRLLLWGAAVGLVPAGGLILYSLVGKKTPLNQATPQLVFIACCLLFCVFPLTLAYVVVVERAMDVRVAIRQGVQYAFAKGGLRLLAFLVITALIAAWNTFIFSTQIGSPWRWVLGLGVSLIIGFGLSDAARRLRGWLDRRFFREAYQSEAILEQLSESVRTTVHEQELLDTIARRISESLHVPELAIFVNKDGALRPVYLLGVLAEEQIEILEDSQTVSLIKNAKEPLRAYFDRKDNWVHALPSEEQNALKAARAQLILPLGRKDRLLGIVTLGCKLSEESYSRRDVQLLSSIALQTGLALENSRLATAIAAELAQRELLNREIEIAREVQERLFPQRLPVLAGIDYSGACRPALAVGGDYYDFLNLSNGDLGIAIGDVSGKGIAAALLMASLQASLRGQAMTGQGDLAVLMSNVNQLVFDATPINRYATFFYGRYSRDTRVFTYVNAGHNAPFVLRRDTGVSVCVIRLDVGGPAIGLLPKAPYQQGTLILQPGDVFVGFTDGISEAMNNEEEEWGEERLIPAVTANANRQAIEIIPSLLEEADRFASGAPQHDDMTLVVMKVMAAAA